MHELRWSHSSVLRLWSIVTLLLAQVEWSLSHLKAARWCCITDPEVLKCRDLATNTNHTQRMSTALECVRGASEEHCAHMIREKQADLITLAPEHLYRAGFTRTTFTSKLLGKENGLVPVAAEFYGQEQGLDYYAVALIRSNAPSHVTFEHLRGLRTCHQAAGDTAGWLMPVGLLLGRGLMPWDEQCSPYVSAARFFEASCVPGALSPDFDQNGRNPKSLCGACTRKKSCPRNESEKYFGERGAYECLIDSSGHVAFVTHTTVFRFTGRGNDFNPGNDFRLLCKNGSRKGVSEFRSCNLARIPARAVASRPGVELEDFKNFVLNIQNNSAFDPFNSTAYGAKDLLFRDNTVGLSDIGEKNTTELWLGKDYSGILKALDSCPVQISRGAVASPLELVALLLVGLLTVEGPT